MQVSEKRLLPRTQLGHLPHGAIALLVQGNRLEICRLHDISNSGISFSIGQAVEVSAQVGLVYSDSNVKLEVFGRVAWCRPEQNATHPGHSRMGVELLSPMMLYAVLPKA